MTKIFSKTATTLIELMISLLLISIILLGIVSINLVLSGNGQDYGQRYFIKSATQTTLNHILNNASLAVGSATTVNGFSNQGIVMGNDPLLGWGDPNSFCIHQGPNNNIDSLAFDIWVCYTWHPSTDPTYPNQIYYCSKPYNTTVVTRGAASCVTAVGAPYIFNFLGTAFSISNPNPPLYTASTGFSITIQNCLNDAASDCSASGSSGDPNNPEVQLTGSVFPPQDGSV